MASSSIPTGRAASSPSWGGAPRRSACVPCRCGKVTGGSGPSGVPPQDSDQPGPAWFENLQGRPLARHVLRVTWPTHFTRAVENQLDYAHLPYVHRRTIGRFARVGAQPRVECHQHGIRWDFGEGRPGFIEYRFPNLWQNCIRPGVSITLAFVPVDEGHTDLYLCSHLASMAARLPGLGPILGWLVNRLNRMVLDEDRRVVLTQAPLDSLEATDEILVGSDRAIRWFRKQVAATSCEASFPLEVSHPVPEP